MVWEKGKKYPQMRRKNGIQHLGSYAIKNSNASRDISGLRPHKKGEFKHSEETKKLLSFKNSKNSRNYWTLHKWLYRYKGKAFGCVDCGLSDKNANYEWSNVSHKYLRNLNDWVSRCIPCHRKYDGNNKLYLYSPLYRKYTEASLKTRKVG